MHIMLMQVAMAGQVGDLLKKHMVLIVVGRDGFGETEHQIKTVPNDHLP